MNKTPIQFKEPIVRNFISNFIKLHGILPIVGVIFLSALVVFVQVYGERMNPFDGKTWSDFDNDKSTHSAADK